MTIQQGWQMPVFDGSGGSYQVFDIWFALSAVHSMMLPFASAAWAMQGVNSCRTCQCYPWP